MIDEMMEIDKAFDPIEFDRALPVELVKITDKGIERARILPNGYPDRHPDFSNTLRPIAFLTDSSLLVSPQSFPEDQDLKSNRRLKLGKIVLPIPDGFLSAHIDDACQQHYGIMPSSRLPYRIPTDIHLNLVVGGINRFGSDQFRKSDLTFSLRNKNVKARDISSGLDHLVYCGALQKLENTDTQPPVAGRKPSQNYLVLWGQSQYFPEKPQRQIAE